MAGSIQLFQLVQKVHRSFFGIYTHRLNPKPRSTNSTVAILLISCAQFMFTMAGFFLFDAKSMFDYGFAFFALVSISNSIAIYLIFIWQSENTFAFVQNGDRFIEKSTYSG